MDKNEQVRDSFRHDLRTHISAIVSLTDLIRNESDPAKSASLIEALHFSALNALAMVEDGTTPEPPSVTTKVRLADWLEGFGRLAEVLTEPSDSSFALILDKSLKEASPWVADPVYLHRALMLLLDNAIKYAGGAKISLSATRINEDYVSLSLSDNGPGFGISDPELLFEPYQRGSVDSSVNGKGLGLWSVRHILAFLGGSIRAEETEPHGATFHITLPCIDGEDKLACFAETPVEKDEAPHGSSALKILIVDDNQTNHLILGEMMRAMDYAPLHATTATSAIEALDRITPDLALIDIRMAGMDGWELAKHILANEKTANIPLVAISSDEPPTSISPFTSWLQRPIEPHTLFDTITGLSSQ